MTFRALNLLIGVTASLKYFKNTTYASVEAEINEVLSGRIFEYAKMKKIYRKFIFQGC